MAYLGLSGIFVAFTGEPSINSIVPDPSLPIVVAHEKAHQRGITQEGEANLVAFMACSRASDSAYVSYSAYLYATAQLLRAASEQSKEEAKSAWAALGPGPRRDLVCDPGVSGAAIMAPPLKPRTKLTMPIFVPSVCLGVSTVIAEWFNC